MLIPIIQIIRSHEDFDGEFPGLTPEQLTQADLRSLPRKFPIHVSRDHYLVEIRHIGKKLHVRLFADYRLPDGIDELPITAIMNEALSAAKYLLEQDRMNDLFYHSVGSWPAIEIRLPESTSGADVLKKIDIAASALLGKANELLRVAATGGIKFRWPLEFA